MLLLLICYIQQRQERLSDCSALLELERKVMHPCWRFLFLLLLLELELPHYSHPCCLMTLSPLFSLPTWTTSSHVFTHLLWSFFFSTSLRPPPPLSLTSPWHQDRRMLERRMAELEEELKVRSHSYRGHRHFACFCSISLALACVFHINCRFHLPTNNYLKRLTQLLFYKLSDISSKTEQNALEAS